MCGYETDRRQICQCADVSEYETALSAFVHRPVLRRRRLSPKGKSTHSHGTSAKSCPYAFVTPGGLCGQSPITHHKYVESRFILRRRHQWTETKHEQPVACTHPVSYAFATEARYEPGAEVTESILVNADEHTSQRSQNAFRLSIHTSERNSGKSQCNSHVQWCQI